MGIKKKIIITAVVILFILLAAGSSVYIFVNGLFGVRGIYYPQVSLLTFQYVQNQSSMALRLPFSDYLYYDGKVYTEVDYTISMEDLKEENLLSDVYNYEFLWSAKEDMLYENRWEGKLYKLDGYRESFRVAAICHVVYPNGERDVIKVFDCLNGIWLKYGKDLYQSRLKAGEDCKVYIGAFEPEETDRIRLATEDEEAFLKALYAGRFIENKNDKELQEELKNAEQYRIYLEREDGRMIGLTVYTGGYAVYTHSNEYYVSKLPEEVVDFIKDLDND